MFFGVLYLFVAPCNCDSDEHVGTIKFSKLFSESPLVVARGLSWKAL
jgi:hypothetical protein